MKTREQILKEKYGFDKGSYKYVPRGSEILKYQGQVVLHVWYKKKEDGTWDSSYETVLLMDITDYDPLNSTYKAKIKKDKNTEPYEFRIIPEGYNWVESDQAEFIERLLPLSMHYQLVEDEAMYTRFAQLYDTAPTTSLESLLGLSMSKEKIQTLRYSRHLACLIRMTTGETLYFRIHGLSVRHKSGKTYNLSIEDPEGTKYKILANSDQDSYSFENVGDFKIIDLISNESNKSEV